MREKNFRQLPLVSVSVKTPNSAVKIHKYQFNYFFLVPFFVRCYFSPKLNSSNRATTSFSVQKNGRKRGKNELWKPLIYSFDRYVKRPILDKKYTKSCQKQKKFRVWNVDGGEELCTKILLCPSWTNTIENMGNCPRVHSSLWLLYLIEIFPPPPFCHAGFLDEWISQCFFFFDQSATTASFAF